MKNKESETMTPAYKVGVVEVEKALYPARQPYNPGIPYPEYPFPEAVSDTENHVYAGVRELFHKLGYDRENWGTSKWNPLGSLIKPGTTVLLKPNFVLSQHDNKKDIFSIITHPSVLRVIVDYCLIALNGHGKVVIADAPQYNCDWDELMRVTHLPEIANFINSHSKVKLEILDLRNYWSRKRHFPSERMELKGDPLGSVSINLSENSSLEGHGNPTALYGAVYHRQETIENHTSGRHNYEISKTILSADVVISVPKLKVHKKVGVTLNLKGLVGASTNKNLIVHYTLGKPSEGGDQFPEGVLTKTQNRVIKFERWMYDHFLAKRTIRHELIHRFIYGFLYLKIFSHLGLRIPKEKRLLDAGNWHGNDTAWRMVVDLTKIIYLADKDGVIHDKPARKLFTVIDGIIGGENNGPLSPDPKIAGVLLGGENLIATDIVATRLMGFDPMKLKQFSETVKVSPEIGPKTVDKIEVVSNNPTFEKCLRDENNDFLSFKPHPGWTGHIET